MKTKIWKKFSRKNLALIASSGVLIFVYQNCSRGFQTIENMSDFSSIAGSLQMQVGAFQKNPFTCASADVQSANSTQRMTRVQYANNLKNLIGAQAYPQFDSAVNTLYSDILKKTVGDFSNTISDTQMTAYQMIAESVYVYLKANVSVLQQLGGTCSQTTPLASICRDAFIQKIGLLAFHRPLTASEVQSWATNVFALGTDTNDSMAATIYAMMLAPDFLLHIEVGDGTSADTNTFNLTPYEVAARLSYGLMDAPPDQDLLDAAAAGQLSTSAQIEAQVDRILQTQPARDKINNFFTFWLDPRRYPAGDFGTDFLQGVDVAATNDEYARELTEYVDYVVFTKKGTFQDLITGA
ncbi:MAG TPA: DUF1592 domain-containing protein, partial [Bdellovibrio sp.]|nr:DUF1592 domain-containing protein [Bdellovibrio sp.]